jgi:cbb3-type cytochrome oxidase subunit 3
MIILYILFIMVICSILYTAMQFRLAHRKEYDNLNELFEDTTTNNFK